MTSEHEHIRAQNAEEFRRKYKSKVKPQTEMIIEYIEKYGSITPLEALTAFNCMRLGARIFNLRHNGYNIVTKINTGEKRYAIYSLAEN